MTTAAEHLAELDAAPGLAVGAHVVGSSALGDHVFDSDLDLVVELSRVDVEVLAAAQRVDLDVIYVLAGELAKPVSLARTVAWGRDGKLNTSEQGDLTPVLWEQLGRYSQTVRGARPSPPVTAAEVVDYCRENLRSYWEPLLDQAATVLENRDEVHPVFREPLLWVTFGPARLWHTIRTGEIVSKTRAVELAALEWPDLAPRLLELAAARRDASVELTVEHGFAALELGHRVLAVS